MYRYLVTGAVVAPSSAPHRIEVLLHTIINGYRSCVMLFYVVFPVVVAFGLFYGTVLS